MKKTTDWGTWVSLGVIVAVCVAIAWRQSPKASPAPEGPERPLARPMAGPDKDLHAAAASPSPLERLFEAAADGGTRSAGGSYRLAHPEHTYVLPPSLDLISDLTAADAKSLWAVTGDKGSVYRLLIKDGSLAETIDFGPAGEYEGIEAVDGGIFVARSDATLFAIDSADGGTSSFDTHLGPTCSLSGLAWDSARKRLLLVCKFPMPKLPKARKSYAIYAMKLETRRVIAEPIVVLPRQAIDDYLGTHPDQPGLKPSMAEEFTPTAIAVQPGSGQIYLLSGRGTMLVVLAPNGTLQRVEALDPVAHPHPKGIAFSPDGTLFISNASRGAHALIQRYGEGTP